MTPGDPGEVALEATPTLADPAGAHAAPSPGLAALPATMRRRWLLGIAGWALLAVAAYAAVGDHLNAYLSATGLMVGFVVGLTGMGGGALMTPILIFAFGFSPTTAIGTDVTYAAVTKVFGSWRHWRHGSVDLPLALWLAAGSVPASLLGVGTVTYVKNNYGELIDGILYRAIGGALMAVGVLLIVKVVIHVGKEHDRLNVTLSLRGKLLTVLLGASAGFVIGLTSVGSGTFLALFLILLYPLTTDRIVGTDIFHAAILLLATGVAQIGVGNVDLWMVAALLIGSIPGVIVGSHLTRRAPSRVLRVCLAVVLFLSGLALIGKA